MVSAFADDFADMMLDTLTFEIFNPGPEDPGTGVPLGAGTTTLVLTQPCADEDVSPSKRFRVEINNGIPANLPISIAYTAYAQLPTLGAGESFVVRVNGKHRPLMRAGPPQDIGAQKLLWELELGAPLV